MMTKETNQKRMLRHRKTSHFPERSLPVWWNIIFRSAGSHFSTGSSQRSTFDHPAIGIFHIFSANAQFSTAIMDGPALSSKTSPNQPDNFNKMKSKWPTSCFIWSKSNAMNNWVVCGHRIRLVNWFQHVVKYWLSFYFIDYQTISPNRNKTRKINNNSKSITVSRICQSISRQSVRWPTVYQQNGEWGGKLERNLPKTFSDVQHFVDVFVRFMNFTFPALISLNGQQKLQEVSQKEEPGRNDSDLRLAFRKRWLGKKRALINIFRHRNRSTSKYD